MDAYWVGATRTICSEHAEALGTSIAQNIANSLNNLF
jgi:hypothetical protein